MSNINTLKEVALSTLKQEFVHPLLQYNFFIEGIPGVLNVNCQASSLPGVKNSKIPVKFRGRELYYSGAIAKFEDWTITMREDIYYRARTSLEVWHDLMSNNMFHMGMITPIIQRDLDIYMLAPGVNIPVAHYKLYNAFPHTIGAVTIDQTADEALVTYEVIFSIDAWQRIDTTIASYDLTPASESALKTNA